MAVSVQCEPTLPAVWADHDRLEQVFVNLLNNALRHNPAGTRVTVIARERTGPAMPGRPVPTASAPAEVEIRIADDGSGFPAELAQAPFDTARRQRPRGSGAGLGLSITRGIVDAHGGRIALVPAPAGTTFQVCLPVEAADDPGRGGEDHEAGSHDERASSLAGARQPTLASSDG
jgi:signal transduction histidine kinase